MPLADALPSGRRDREQSLLLALARRVRHLLDLRGMSRKFLAEQARVSVPHVARLEAGNGNVSVLILGRLAHALGVPLSAIFEGTPSDAAHDRSLPLECVRAATATDLPVPQRSSIGPLSCNPIMPMQVALLGMRGSGKSTVGAALAARLEVPFVELDHEIEMEAEMPLAAIFAKHGQAAYRSLELRMLEQTLLRHGACVMATGGGIVTAPDAYELIRRHCFTVWLYARNDVYLARVRAQPDMRIAAPTLHRTSMDIIRRTMDARRTLYAAARVRIDSTERSAAEVVVMIATALAGGTPSAWR